MVLSLDNIWKSYRTGATGEVPAVRGVSMNLDAGEFVAVRGPSGCGKSTLMLIAGGLLAPDSGRVRVNDTDPYSLGGDARARFRAEQIGFVFQQFHLVPYLSVLDNVLAPTVATGGSEAARARELVDRFGLSHRVNHVPGQLSTGERQRTALARALLNRPKLLLADEPTGNLDGESAEAVLGYLTDFAGEGGTVLLVTHDDRAAAVAQKSILINDGKLKHAAISGRGNPLEPTP